MDPKLTPNPLGLSPPGALPPGFQAFNTNKLACYSVEFSPFNPTLLSVCASQHYGIIGNGAQLVLEQSPQGLRVVSVFETQDGLFESTWSEQNESHLFSASGDGTIKLWDLTLPPNQNPLRSYEEHKHEVYGLDYNLVSKDCFVSGAWDDTVKLWNPELNNSIKTWAEHKYCIYSTIWCPHSATMFGSASGDFTIKIWDIRQDASVSTIMGSQFEILSFDWNKYKEWEIVSGDVEKSVNVWDVRNLKGPVLVLRGHDSAVRRVKCSPFDENVFASVSYDMTMALWDLADENDPLVMRMDRHTEFVLGVDFSNFDQTQLATCGWDENVFVFQRSLEAQKKMM